MDPEKKQEKDEDRVEESEVKLSDMLSDGEVDETEREELLED